MLKFENKIIEQKWERHPKMFLGSNSIRVDGKLSRDYWNPECKTIIWLTIPKTKS
jgi:hypothetical protein